MLTYRYRLQPTRQQHAALAMILEQQRQLYNAALQERIEAHRYNQIVRLRYGANTDKAASVTLYSQSKGLTEIRRADPEFAAVQRRIQKETLRRLDRAFAAFFQRAKKGGAPGFPRFKGRDFFTGFGFDAFQQVKFDGKRIRFSGMPGGLRVKVDRPLPSSPIKGIVFRKDGKRWLVGFQVAAPVAEPRDTGQRVGIDWGVSNHATLSTGHAIANPRIADKWVAEVRRRQRSLSRCRRGSKTRAKVREALAAAKRHEANARRNHVDKMTATLCKQYRGIAIEDLNVRGMSASAKGTADAPGRNVKSKAGLNRAVLDASPYAFRKMLEYKSKREGTELVVVPARGTSQECSACGARAPKLLSERRHVCSCGADLDRDHNAALNIRNRAGWGPGAGNVGHQPERSPRNTVEQSTGPRDQRVIPSLCAGKQQAGSVGTVVEAMDA